MPFYLGAIVYRQSGGFLATSELGLVIISLDPLQITPWIQILNSPEQLRMNEAKCDRLGRLWAGSAVLNPKTSNAALYCIDPSGCHQLKQSHLKISNGLGQSPDNRLFYHNDSLSGMTYCYDFDLESGQLSHRRDFHRCPDNAEPDGLTVDAEGGIWIAFWNGYRVSRFHPNGDLDMTIETPVARPTSVMFGGEDLSTLFITSCNHLNFIGEQPQQSPAGALFALKTDWKGLAEPGCAY